MLAIFIFFFFNDTATTEIYTLSLHDALPISNSRLLTVPGRSSDGQCLVRVRHYDRRSGVPALDRKSTRLNSSHTVISYAVFCLKKKKKKNLDSRFVLVPWCWCNVGRVKHDLS